ncbi:hypothetical protein BC826DRAFT_972538 [Russula brevipes]|nr:hypothetical protein BC826DRAFT_972538 [Russula brevipes]
MRLCLRSGVFKVDLRTAVKVKLDLFSDLIIPDKPLVYYAVLPLDHFLFLIYLFLHATCEGALLIGLWVTVLIDYAFGTRLGAYTTYSRNFEDDKWTFPQIRKADDLPTWLTGRATWNSFLTPARNSYHIRFDDGTEQPIEFINNKGWYLLAWLDDEQCYTTKTSYAFTPDYPVLGTHENPFPSGSPLLPIVTTPTPKGKERQRGTPRETPTREQSPTESFLEQKAKGKHLERAPPLSMSETISVTTARTRSAPGPMATDEGTTGEPSYFHSSARDPPGGDEPPGGGYHGHNPGGNPGGDPNPMPGGPPGGGGGGLPQGEALAGCPLEREGGALNGQPPATFRGDRSQTMKFMHQFSLWKRLNSNKTIMRMPGQRVALALTLMEGERVDNWVMKQTQLLIERVDGVGRRRATHTEDDEELWTTFAADFLLAFTHTASKEEAYSKLTKLTMKDYLVDEYISAYEILVIQADWDRESAGAVVLFKDGLPAWLCHRIMMRDNTPLGIRGWQEAKSKIPWGTDKDASRVQPDRTDTSAAP